MKIVIGMDGGGYYFRQSEGIFYNKYSKRFEHSGKNNNPASHYYMTESEVCDILNKYYFEPIIIEEDVISEHIRHIVDRAEESFTLNGAL